jgi:hypothetical protein
MTMQYLSKEELMKQSGLFIITLLIALTTFVWADNQPCVDGDINGDCRIGMEEALAALKAVAGLTQEPEPQAKAVEHVANYNTKALSDAQNDVASLEQLTSILTMIPLPEPQPQKRNLVQGLFESLTQANISCADISQDETGVIITFNEKPFCLGMKGSIHISVSDNTYTLEFDNVAKDHCPIDGTVTVLINHENETVSADLKFENMSIYDHPIDGEYAISFDKITGILTAVDFKEKIKSFMIDGKEIQAKFKAVYDKLTGFSGYSTMTLNNQTYHSEFRDYYTDPMNGLPANGSMDINDIKLVFKETFSKDNPVISYFINDVPVNLKLTANQIQQGTKDFAQKIANFATSMFSNNHDEINFIETITTVFSKMDLPTLINNLKQTQSRSVKNSDQVIQNIDFSSCGNVSVDTNDGISIIYDFQAMPDCYSITGKITVVPNISDQSLTILFEDLLIKNCLINGNTTITLTSALTAIHANIVFDNMSVCGKIIDGSYDITYDKLTGKIMSAQTKKIIETIFRNIDIQIPSTVSFDSETGLNGYMTIPVMGKSYTCYFNAIKIEEKCGLPLSGTLQINEFEINFDELSCDNRIVNGILDGMAFKIEMFTNRISDKYQDMIDKLNQFSTMVVSKHGFDIEMLTKVSLVPSLVPSLTKVFQQESPDWHQIINILSASDFTCGTAFLDIMPLSAGYTFDGSCNGVTGTVRLSLDQGSVHINYDQLSFDNGDCTIDGEMQIDVTHENETTKFTQTTNNLNVCGNNLNGTLEVINGLGTPVIINRKGTDILIINGDEYAVSSDISYTQNKGLNGSFEFTKNGQVYYCEVNDIKFDLTCGIPTSGTIAIDRIILDFSETTCENPEVNVIIFGMTMKMSINEILDMLKNF